ncbi:hypothetical protein ALC62_14742, partial [Cyphomyrmex costatus]
LINIVDSDNVIVETLDAHYEAVKSLCHLNACNTMRCIGHTKNYTLQNIFKIFNW